MLFICVILKIYLHSTSALIYFNHFLCSDRMMNFAPQIRQGKISFNEKGYNAFDTEIYFRLHFSILYSIWTYDFVVVKTGLRPQHEYENSIQAIYVIHLYTKQLQLQNIDQNSIVSWDQFTVKLTWISVNRFKKTNAI